MVSLLAITAAKDVIDGHFIFDSALWWHELILPLFNLCVNRELDETMGDPFDQRRRELEFGRRRRRSPPPPIDGATVSRDVKEI
jgi:hypothetical protein